eukprot:TRINITY_DN12311_c0_g2_i1.p3 TRINITY_DN12311_c0_g2~~TRINITY_DN12311_c0_g2_i1.p3  ORF type:complete len:412 (-),score=97.59 TRINITY_DN12311_c0_g2_i1:832-2067(-)
MLVVPGVPAYGTGSVHRVAGNGQTAADIPSTQIERLVFRMEYDTLLLYKNKDFIMKLLLKMLVIIALSACLPARGVDPSQIRVDSVLASVNGSPISLLDVVDDCAGEEARLRMMFSGDELKARVKALRRKVLDDAIDRKLIVDDYSNDPFDIPRQHIEDMIDKMSWSLSDGTRKSLKKKIEESGITLEDFEGKAKDRIIIDYTLGTLFYKVQSVTPREIYEFYEQNKDKFSAPATIRLQVLFLQGTRETNRELLKEIAEDVKSGNEKIFTSLVILHSAAPNAKNGGDLGWIETGKLRPEFAAAIKDNAPGFISEPVVTPEGIYFLRIAGLVPGGAKPFEKVNTQISDELNRRMREQTYNNYIKKLRSEAIIRYFIEQRQKPSPDQSNRSVPAACESRNNPANFTLFSMQIA